MTMFSSARLSCALLALVCFLTSHASAELDLVEIITGNVGLSIDAVGSNSDPVGDIQAEIPLGATVRKAYLYAAGTPFPFYPDNGAPPSPTSLAEYNSAGISLGGVAITNFSELVGADSQRADIGEWYTGRADVTSVVQGLVAADPGAASHSWSYAESGAINNRIDGGVLVIAYEDASLPEGSVVLYDGGQSTGGETTTVEFAEPLDTSVPGFFADMSLGISFSTGNDQHSQVDINGTRLSTSAGGLDDGAFFDGGLITAGGIGDSNANPVDPFSTASFQDDELYDLTPFLSDGDLSFEIFTENPTDDDNIFFLGLHVAAEVVPEPSSFLLLGMGLLFIGKFRKHRSQK